MSGLEQWREQALPGIDTALKELAEDPLKTELDTAMRHIDELPMVNSKGEKTFEHGKSTCA
jgi:hypothetical protein